jgi:hypothetical protein
VAQDESKTIDWSQAKGRTAMISTHGDKGKEHRLVILLNASHDIMPDKSHVGNSKEQLDVSVLNVAMTR